MFSRRIIFPLLLTISGIVVNLTPLGTYLTHVNNMIFPKNIEYGLPDDDEDLYYLYNKYLSDD